MTMKRQIGIASRIRATTPTNTAAFASVVSATNREPALMSATQQITE